MKKVSYCNLQWLDQLTLVTSICHRTRFVVKSKLFRTKNKYKSQHTTDVTNTAEYTFCRSLQEYSGVNKVFINTSIFKTPQRRNSPAANFNHEEPIRIPWASSTVHFIGESTVPLKPSIVIASHADCTENIITTYWLHVVPVKLSDWKPTENLRTPPNEN